MIGARIPYQRRGQGMPGVLCPDMVDETARFWFLAGQEIFGYVVELPSLEHPEWLEMTSAEMAANRE